MASVLGVMNKKRQNKVKILRQGVKNLTRRSIGTIERIGYRISDTARKAYINVQYS